MSIEIKTFYPGSAQHFYVPGLDTPYVWASIGVERRSGWFRRTYHVGLEGIYRRATSTMWFWASSGKVLSDSLQDRVRALERKFHYERTLSGQAVALSQKTGAGGVPVV